VQARQQLIDVAANQIQIKRAGGAIRPFPPLRDAREQGDCVNREAGFDQAGGATPPKFKSTYSPLRSPSLSRVRTCHGAVSEDPTAAARDLPYRSAGGRPELGPTRQAGCNGGVGSRRCTQA
jgi:hypothetical protein